MGGCCSTSKDAGGMIVDVENDWYDIMVPSTILTGSAGLVTAKSVLVKNQSEAPVVVINSGDNFSYELHTGSATIKIGADGGELGLSGERKQRERESKASTDIIPKGGSSRIRFHGRQASNYLTFGFYCDGKYQLVAESKLLDAGSEITVKAYPTTEVWVREIVVDNAAGSGFQTAFAHHFLTDLNLKLTQKRKTDLHKFHQENGEPATMDDVLEAELLEQFLQAADIPKRLQWKATQWGAKRAGVGAFFKHIGDTNPGDRLEKAQFFMTEHHLTTMQNVSEFDMEAQFIDAVGLQNPKWETRARKYFESMGPGKKAEKGNFARSKSVLSGAGAALRTPPPSGSARGQGAAVPELAGEEYEFPCRGDTYSVWLQDGKMMVCDVDYAGDESRRAVLTHVVFSTPRDDLASILLVLKPPHDFCSRCDECGKTCVFGDWCHRGRLDDLCAACYKAQRVEAKKREKDDNEKPEDDDEDAGEDDEDEEEDDEKPGDDDLDDFLDDSDDDDDGGDPFRSDGEDEDENWVSFASMKAVAAHASRCKYFDMSYYAQGAEPLDVEEPEDWTENRSKQFEASCEKGGVVVKRFVLESDEDEEELEQYLESLLPDGDF